MPLIRSEKVVTARGSLPPPTIRPPNSLIDPSPHPATRPSVHHAPSTYHSIHLFSSEQTNFFVQTNSQKVTSLCVVSKMNGTNLLFN